MNPPSLHWSALAAALLCVATSTPAFEAAVFDPAAHSQAITACDRAAGHPDDPYKVLPGLEQGVIDLPGAIAACRADLAKDANNPRLLYLLARVLAYSGSGAEGLPYIERSAAAGYPQALFVTGYLYLEGLYEAPRDPCRAAALVRESALRGRIAGQVGLPAWHLAGRFAGCDFVADPTEMLRGLEAARQQKPDYYQGLLIDGLTRELRARHPQLAASEPD